MIESILADLSVLMCAVLFFFLYNENKVLTDSLTTKDRLKFIALVTGVGTLLIKYSVVVDGARYDYRFLLYALSIKFLGKWVTIPSIFLISLFRLFWGTDIHTLSSSIYGFVLMLTLPIVYKGCKKYHNDFAQIVLLTIYNLFIGAFLNLLVYKNFFKDGHMYLVLIFSSVLMIFIFMWIRHQISAIYRKSEVDFLTNLYNSRKFYYELANHQRTSKTKIISMIDIDFFKRVNDQHGHLAGDDILRRVTQIFLAHQKSNSKFYRIGGEEFACLLQGYTVKQTIELMNKIRQEVASMVSGLVNENGETLKITISIGLTVIEPTEEIHQSLLRADEALYYSKSTGRDKVSLGQGTSFFNV